MGKIKYFGVKRFWWWDKNTDEWYASLDRKNALENHKLGGGSRDLSIQEKGEGEYWDKTKGEWKKVPKGYFYDIWAHHLKSEGEGPGEVNGFVRADFEDFDVKEEEEQPKKNNGQEERQPKKKKGQKGLGDGSS